jgi:tetratricopeptide (TPR) repeat protein
VAKRLTDVVTSDDPESKRWRSLFTTAKMTYEAGDFRESDTLLAKARELATKIPEREFAIPSVDVATAAVWLAQHRHKEAISKLEKCISSLEKETDPQLRELLAIAKRFLAQALFEKGDAVSAEATLLESISVLRKIGPYASGQLAFSLCDLCGLYTTKNEVEKTEALVQEIMQISSQEFEPGSPEYVRSDMIYTVLRPMSHNARHDAIAEGIRKMEYSFGGKHPLIERALQRYIKVLSEEGDKERLAEAEAQLKHR